ncbi:Crp/Fnr family transcriptional regulator [Ideonella sp.]|uniref:Crp/Fnr family transcriptional regulator n=1 Tax=Ideonella sp. TaxID=1929293 RepID=UPI0035AF083D
MQDQDIPEPERPPADSDWPGTLGAWREVLLADAWFAGAPPALRAALLRLGRLQALGPGQALFGRGQAAEGLCCVLSGALRVGAVQADGSETVLAFVEPGQWFGEISLIDGQPRTHDAVADGPTAVLLVPQAALLAWLAEHPAHWQAVAQLACAKLRMLFDVIEDIARLPLEARLAKRLWLVAHGYGARTGTPRRMLHLPQEQLALMLGVSRQSANKALRALAARGVIVLHYGGIELLDLAALAALGQDTG